MNQLTEQLKTRFFRYVGISSQSLASNSVVPSTEGQRELAKTLGEYW